MEDIIEYNEHALTQKMRIALIAHFNNSVPIDRLNIDKRQKDMLARVEHVYWQYLKNPFLDVHAMFYEMAKQRYKEGEGRGRGNAFRLAKTDERVFEFVRDSSAPPSRKDREAKVRYAADKLMERGLNMCDDRALAKGAELSIKLDHLDKPEEERIDMSRMMFLPPVVTTNVNEVDDTKEDVNDSEMKRIMEKYNGYVDEKERNIDHMVDVMVAKRGT